MESVNDKPPTYDEGSKFSVEWLSQVLGEKVSQVEQKALTDVGGMMCALQRVVVTYASGTKQSFVFKQIHVDDTSKTTTSKSLGLIREAKFYNSELANNFGGSIAKCRYAYGNDTTGEKYLLLEDLSPAIQAGFFFGAGNPNQWSKKAELDAICESSYKSGATLDIIVTQTFRDMARIHAKFWKNPELKTIDWVRASDWYSGNGKELFDAIQGDLTKRWEATKVDIDAKGFHEKSGVQWDLGLIEIIDASVKQIGFETYQKLISQIPFTLVLGDCHPSNTMWIPEVPFDKAVRFVDFEMIAIGSGAQDLAQYLISHMTPQKRKESEKDYVKAYYEELTKNGVSDYTFDECWKDYVAGGSERWIWFVVWMSSGAFGKEVTSFFNSQTLAFLTDHGVTASEIGQPRP